MSYQTGLYITPPKRYDIVFYHANCADGFGAAWAAWKALGDTAEYHPLSYHREVNLELCRDKRVLMVDVTVKAAHTKEILDVCEHLTVIDHHVSAWAELGDIDRVNFSFYFDEEESGATLAWDFFQNSYPPKLLRYVKDYDLWLHKLENTHEINAAIKAYPFDFKVWDELDVEQLLIEGRGILRFLEKQRDIEIGKAFMIDFAGHLVPAVNAAKFQADAIANKLAENHPFAVVFSVGEQGIYFSLRSNHETGLKVEPIAKALGGGGHAHAAAVQLPHRHSIAREACYPRLARRRLRHAIWLNRLFDMIMKAVERRASISKLPPLGSERLTHDQAPPRQK